MVLAARHRGGHKGESGTCHTSQRRTQGSGRYLPHVTEEVTRVRTVLATRHRGGHKGQDGTCHTSQRRTEEWVWYLPHVTEEVTRVRTEFATRHRGGHKGQDGTCHTSQRLAQGSGRFEFKLTLVHCEFRIITHIFLNSIWKEKGAKFGWICSKQICTFSLIIYNGTLLNFNWSLKVKSVKTDFTYISRKFQLQF